MLYQRKNREFPMEVTIFPQAFDSFSDYVFHNNLLKNFEVTFNGKLSLFYDNYNELSAYSFPWLRGEGRTLRTSGQGIW